MTTQKEIIQTRRKLKSQIATAIRAAHARAGISHSELARRMKTSRMVTSRLMNHDDTSCTLATIAAACHVLKVKLKIQVA